MSEYAQDGSTYGSVYAQQGTLGSPYLQEGGRVPYLGPAPAAGGRVPYLGKPAAKKKPHHHHGFGGLLGNFGADVGNFAIGVGPGLAKLAKDTAHDAKKFAEHPIAYNPKKDSKLRGDIVMPTAKQYAQTYGPLFHGDVSTFLNNLYEHPLGPILDAATIATGGAGLAAKAGRVAAEAGLVSDASRLAKLGEPGEIALRSPGKLAGQDGRVLTKPTSRNPAIRAREQAFDKLLKLAPAHTPTIGEVSRYARELRRLPQQDAQRLRLASSDYNRAVKNLTNEEFAAVHIIGRGVHPTDLREVWADDPTMQKVLANPKINELVDHPTAKVLHAVGEARKLADLSTQLKVDRGILKPETAAARVTLHQRLAREKLGRELQPMAHSPFYVPDVAVANKTTIGDLTTARGGGMGVQRNPIKQNKGVLFSSARLALHPDLLGPDYLRTVKYAYYDDLHSHLVGSAVRVSRQQIQQHGLPEGYVFLRRKLISKTGSAVPEKIKPLAKLTGDNQRSLEQLIPNPGDLSTSQMAREGFGTADAAGAETVHGDYLIVPDRLAKDVAGEFHRSSAAVRTLIAKPLNVWRSIVLGFRPGFLINNVVGNNLMYAIHFAGPDGIRAYLNAVKRQHGTPMVRTLLKQRYVPPAMREQFMREFFPEQVQSFGGTQAVAPGKPTALLGKAIGDKAARQVRRGSVGLVPATQAVAETTLRRAATEAALRATPEFKRVYRAMPRQTRDFEHAARLALKENPHLQRMVSDKVNAALGDYSNLSAFEQHALRQLVPFWAWLRAITTVTAKLAADNPARAQILAKLGAIGEEDTRQKLGPIEDFLRGAIPVGKPNESGVQTIYNTSGVNPFATVQQLGAAANSLVAGGDPNSRQNVTDELNPFVAALIQALGNAKYGQAPTHGVVHDVGADVVAGLPPVTLAQGLRGSSYRGPTRYQRSPGLALLNFLGIPKKRLNLPVEHAKAIAAVAARSRR